MPPQKSCESVIRRTMQRQTFGLVLGVAWFLLPNSAHAEVPHYRVELSVPASLSECNREADLLGMIEPMITGPMLEPPFTRVITVRIAKTQAIYRLDLFVKELDGRPVDEVHTEFPASMSCFEVLYRGALRASLHMNLNAPTAEKAPEPPPAKPPPSVALPQCPVCETPKQPPKPAKNGRRFFVGAGGLVGFGIAPEIVAGMQLLGGWKLSRSWSIELNASATIPQETRPSGPTTVHIYTVASLVLAAPCYRVGSFGVCGLIDGSAMWRGRDGITQSDTARSASFRLGLRGFMDHRFADRWSVRLDADIATPVQRSSIDDDAQKVHWTMPHVTGRVGAAILTWF